MTVATCSLGGQGPEFESNLFDDGGPGGPIEPLDQIGFLEMELLQPGRTADMYDQQTLLESGRLGIAGYGFANDTVPELPCGTGTGTGTTSAVPHQIRQEIGQRLASGLFRVPFFIHGVRCL